MCFNTYLTSNDEAKSLAWYFLHAYTYLHVHICMQHALRMSKIVSMILLTCVYIRVYTYMHTHMHIHKHACSKDEAKPSVWILLYMYLYIHAIMGTSVYGYFCIWILLYMDTSVYGYFCIWILLYMDTSVYGYFCIWVLLYMDTSVYGYFCICICTYTQSYISRVRWGTHHPIMRTYTCVWIKSSRVLRYHIVPWCVHIHEYTGIHKYMHTYMHMCTQRSTSSHDAYTYICTRAYT